MKCNLKKSVNKIKKINWKFTIKNSKNFRTGNSVIILLTLFIHLLMLSNFPKIQSYCGHDKFEHAKERFVPVKYNYNSNWQPIRIEADYSNFQISEDEKVNSFAKLLEQEIIPKTIRILNRILSVREIDYFMLTSNKCTKHVSIPDNFLNKKIFADMLIIVTFDETGKYIRNKVEASAIHCYQDQLTKRPIVGKITFRNDLNPESQVDIDYMVWLALHEISHILLFNKALYKHFIDENFNPLPIEKILYETANQKGQKIFYITTKNVLQKAINHFKCPGLEGVPLEYNTNGKSAISGHWSRRAMNTDYMIGRSHGENFITEITLAFFEDSGWYKPDYSTANIFFWGKNKGCDFLLGNCVKNSKVSDDFSIINVQTKYKKEFCQFMNQPACSMHNQFRGFCGIKVFDQDLPFDQRNFASPRVGGYDTFVNRCPIVVENKYSQQYYGGNCKFGSNEGIMDFERICPECACFLSSLSKTLNDEEIVIDKIHSNSSETQLRAGCYEYKCVEGKVYVVVEGKDYRCRGGKSLSIPGFYGRMYCPSKKILCDKRYFCKFGCTDI